MSFSNIAKLWSRLTSAEMEVNGDKNVDKNGSVREEGQRKTGDNNNDNDPTVSRTGVSGNKGISGRRRFGENGFEEEGGYMAVKKAKLDNQFNASTRVLNADNLEKSSNGSNEIFKNISVHINGYTNPPEPELRELFIRHGGTFHPYHSLTLTTYAIATNLSAPSKRLYGSKTVKPEWITESIKAGKVLDTRDFMLYNLNEEKNQLTISQFIRPKDSTAIESASNVAMTVCNESRVEEGDNSLNKSSDSDEFFECSQENIIISPNGTSPQNDADLSSSSKEEIVSNIKSTEVFEVTNSNQQSMSSECESLILNDQVSDANIISKTPPKTGIKTATDDGFIEDFFGRSRLHLISEQKKEMQMYIGNLRKNINAHDFTNLKKFEEEIGLKRDGSNINPSIFSESTVVLMHIDMDCFFVSVGLLSRPHLRGKPVVVTHSSGKTQESRSDIACASYEARKFGVRNGMWVGEAKELCSELEVIPYDFEEYRRISKLFYQAVASITLDLEGCSVDEMVVDATSVLKKVQGSTAEDLADFFRKIIFAETQCPASVGIGSNRLLAKLAVKLAKPNGVHYLRDCDAPSYIQGLNVRDLPGVGWSNQEKLREIGVETCADLLNVPLTQLKNTFGEKTAEKMHSLCKGIDTSEIKMGLDRPKSLSVDVNFGIRFQKEEDVTNFLVNICKELANRAEKIQAVANNFTLKLLIRKKGAGEPLKQGGHGIVDCVTRSRKLMNPTRNWHELYKTACSLIRAMRIPPTDYRGVGVSLTDLAFDCDKPNKKSVQRTLTDMPLSSRAQKMLSLSQKKVKVPTTEKVNPATATLPLNITNNHNNYAPQSSDGLSLNASFETVPNKNGVSENNDARTVQPLIPPSTNTNDNQPLPVDISVLRQLPREIAEEQCQFYGINTALLDTVEENDEKAENETVETVDQSFLLALPENVRQEVLHQLQEANGTKGKVILQLDDQKPCSSKQALQRNKILEEQEKLKMQHDDQQLEPGSNPIDGSNESTTTVGERNICLEEKTTPLISYCNTKHGQNDDTQSNNRIDPKNFWNPRNNQLVLPATKIILPALNNCTDMEDVRNLIRQGLEIVTDPTTDDVGNLDQYFKELISNCWLQQAQILLKFLYRRLKQLPPDSKWKPILTKLIEDSQRLCVQYFHGAINLES